VLRDEVTRDDLDDAAVRRGWQLSNVLPASSERPAQIIFADVGLDSFLYVVDERRLGVMYLTASGADAAAMMACARAELSCYAADDHVELLDGDVAQVKRGLALLVMHADTARADAVRCLSAALRHAKPDVRSAALTAASYALWSELRPVLAEIAIKDEVSALRAAAGQLVVLLPETP
jgi:hypothetical protein